jgi:hypothetical protein
MENGKKPAFNYTVGLCDSEIESMGGLTKREYFAGLAMQGLMANPREEVMTQKPDEIAKWSISFADELLKQLES